MDKGFEFQKKVSNREIPRDVKMNIKFVSKYLYDIIELIMYTIFLTYILGCLWNWFTTDEIGFNANKDNFITKYKIHEESLTDQVILNCYYVITT